MSYWEILNYKPCFSSTSLIIHEQKTKKILPKHWFGFLHRFLRTLDFSWISVRKDSPKYFFFFFQLLTATCENSSTRLEKRLENSKSVKWFIEKIAPQSGGILQKFVCWGSRSTACEIPGRACLHGGGGPQIGEVTCGGSPCLSCKRDQIKMIDYIDRWVTHQSRLPHLPGVPQLHVNRP